MYVTGSVQESLQTQANLKVDIQPNKELKERIGGPTEEEIVNSGLEYTMSRSGNFLISKKKTRYNLLHLIY